MCRLYVKKSLCTILNVISLFFHCGKNTVPFFHRGDTEAPQRPQRSERRKRDAFFQRGHRGAAFFLLMRRGRPSLPDIAAGKATPFTVVISTAPATACYEI